MSTPDFLLIHSFPLFLNDHTRFRPMRVLIFNGTQNLKFCIHHLDWLNLRNFPELKTFEWDILNPDRIINLEIKNEKRTSIIYSRD